MERAIEVAPAADRRAPARLVYRPDQPQHAPDRRGGGRLPLRCRRLFGRSALLDEGGGEEPPDRALFAGDQRHALRQREHADRRPVLRLSARHVRHALRGGRGAAEDDVGRAPLPARRAGRASSPGSSGSCRHALGHQDVWFCRRIEIARHWRATHPASHVRGSAPALCQPGPAPARGRGDLCDRRFLRRQGAADRPGRAGLHPRQI